MNGNIEKIFLRCEFGNELIYAFSEFLNKDLFLLQIDANERSLTHRVGIYLQNALPEWDVDCEYNRDDHDPKELTLHDIKSDIYDTDAHTVYPDIIVHKRGKNDNLLVIEFKKTSSQVGDKKDFAKLEAYMKQLDYTYALFIEFKVGYNNPGIRRAEWIPHNMDLQNR